MSSLVFKVEGLEKLRKALQEKAKDIEQEIGMEIQDSAENIANNAALEAPVDQGMIKAQISSKKEDDLNYDVVSPIGYSPFVEFGTRSKVKIPAGLEKIAAEYRGMKSEGDAKKAIFDWCRRKGIPEDAWYPIYRSVMVNGITPQPFFFKQLDKEKPRLIKNIQNVLKHA